VWASCPHINKKYKLNLTRKKISTRPASKAQTQVGGGGNDVRSASGKRRCNVRVS
jgi:hypothetical protein